LEACPSGAGSCATVTFGGRHAHSLQVGPRFNGSSSRPSRRGSA
jgi:hypothetical protein